MHSTNQPWPRRKTRVPFVRIINIRIHYQYWFLWPNCVITTHIGGHWQFAHSSQILACITNNVIYDKHYYQLRILACCRIYTTNVRVVAFVLWLLALALALGHGPAMQDIHDQRSAGGLFGQWLLALALGYGPGPWPLALALALALVSLAVALALGHWPLA